MSGSVYQITGENIETIKMELELILRSISERLDAMEEGAGVIRNRIDIVDDDFNRVHGFNNEVNPKA